MNDTSRMREVKLAPDAAPVAREIHRRMMDARLSQKALADQAGVGLTYVRDLFQAKSKNPKSDQLSKIAKRLGCSVEDLAGADGSSGGPGRPEETEKDRYTAKTPQERALLDVWRNASDFGRDQISAAIERALLGALASRTEVKKDS